MGHLVPDLDKTRHGLGPQRARHRHIRLLGFWGLLGFSGLLDKTTTGLDKTTTVLDKLTTGLDKTTTGLDKTTTGLDMVQTLFYPRFDA